MHSATLDSSGSPKKRVFSRGVSEDESLRNIIKEAESSTRRLTRSDSRAGTLKKRTDSQSEQDLLMGLPEMLELQASYDEVVQELRGLEVERETLLFQVDVLQDTLEGVEELLAEAQREAGQASAELEREKEAKRKLESMVSSLMKEVERMKEENSGAAASEYDTETSSMVSHKEETDSPLIKQTSSESSKAGSPSPGMVGQGEGTQDEGTQDEESLLEKMRKMVSKSSGRMPSLALSSLISEVGVLQRPYKNGIDGECDPSEDTNDTDSVSAYEDASADTPENDMLFPGEADTVDMPHDLANANKPQENEKPEACIVS